MIFAPEKVQCSPNLNSYVSRLAKSFIAMAVEKKTESTQTSIHRKGERKHCCCRGRERKRKQSARKNPNTHRTASCYTVFCATVSHKRSRSSAERMGQGLSSVERPPHVQHAVRSGWMSDRCGCGCGWVIRNHDLQFFSNQIRLDSIRILMRRSKHVRTCKSIFLPLSSASAPQPSPNETR